MRKSIKKKLFIPTLIFTIFIALPWVSAEETTISTLEDLKTCLTSEQLTCTLEDDINDMNEALPINKSKTINLNGHNIKGSGASGAFFGINTSQTIGVEVKITGQGTIEYTAEEKEDTSICVYGATDATEESVTHFIIDKEVTIKNLYIAFFDRRVSGSYGHASYGASMDFYGTLIKEYGYYPIYVQGNIHNPTNPVTINIMDDATITSENNIAIMQAGNATTNIHNATITGASGIGIKSGNLNIYGGSITGTSDDTEASETDTGADVIKANGSAIQIKTTAGDYGNINIQIEDGKLESKHNNTIFEYIQSGDNTNVEDIEISGGEFIAPEGVETISGSESFTSSHTNFVSGGTFSDDIPTEFLAPGTVQSATGEVGTKPSPKPTPTPSPTPTPNPEPENKPDEEEKTDDSQDPNPDENITTVPNTSDNILIYMSILPLCIITFSLTLKKVLK